MDGAEPTFEELTKSLQEEITWTRNCLAAVTAALLRRPKEKTMIDENAGPRVDTALINLSQIEAMFRMLIDSGDMTPMARQVLRKLWTKT